MEPSQGVCQHNRTVIIARRDGVDYVECLDCRLITEAEELKARRNSESSEIAALRKQGVDTTEKQRAVREIGERITALDEQVRTLDAEFQELLAGIPNLPHESVP